MGVIGCGPRAAFESVSNQLFWLGTPRMNLPYSPVKLALLPVRVRSRPMSKFEVTKPFAGLLMDGPVTWLAWEMNDSIDEIGKVCSEPVKFFPLIDSFETPDLISFLPLKPALPFFELVTLVIFSTKLVPIRTVIEESASSPALVSMPKRGTARNFTNQAS